MTDLSLLSGEADALVCRREPMKSATLTPFCALMLSTALGTFVGCTENSTDGGASPGATSSLPGNTTRTSQGGSSGLGGGTHQSAAASSQTKASTGGKSGRASSAAGGTGTSYRTNSGGSSDDAGAGGDDSSSGARGGHSSGTSTARTQGGSSAAGGSSSSSATGGTSPSSAGGASGTTTGTAVDSEATIVPDPSWTCGMPDGIPAPTLGTLAFSIVLDIEKTYTVGKTQYGDRRLLTVKSGTVKGDKLQATALGGGLELELKLSNGAVELEQIDILRTSDNTPILMRNCGVAPAGDSTVRVVVDFEVASSSSSLSWLNTGKFAALRTVDTAAGKVNLEVYDISKVTGRTSPVQLKDPEGVPNQSWDCSKNTGTNGTAVFTENVALGNSISIGASKRGSRNIIPITGGTVTGGAALSSFSGSVVAAGADYQLTPSGSSTTLDARYALTSKEGEVIVVRNCGPFGALVPVFETRADGPFAVLTTKSYLSSNPNTGNGGVSITFYERK